MFHSWLKLVDKFSENIFGLSIDCVDKNESCNYWASNGECQNNPDYMLVNCKKSCKNCSGGGGGGEDKGGK